MKTENLFSPIKLGDLQLKNRIFMGATTRTRCVGDDKSVISPMAISYYAQRASAGLLVTECINIAKGGEVGSIGPSIFTEEHIAAWKEVTDGVHAKGGVIFAQLSHFGRVSLPEFNEGITPIAPSAVAFVGQVYDHEGNMIQPPVPRALDIEGIKEVIGWFKRAALYSKAAGFDGIELHVCNGSLTEQFLHPTSNIREDEYGGSVENRARFTLETLDAFIEVFGKERVGIKVSPHNRLSQQHDPNPAETSEYLAKEIEKKGIAYINVLEPVIKDDPFLPFPEENPVTLNLFRDNYTGVLIVNGGYNKESGNQAIADNEGDAVSFSRAFISNPDLVYRLKHDLPLNEPDYNTFYGVSGKGYIDYPFVSEEVTA
jgi:N-ethylmaleimide reductase